MDLQKVCFQQIKKNPETLYKKKTVIYGQRAFTRDSANCSKHDLQHILFSFSYVDYDAVLSAIKTFCSSHKHILDGRRK